jgi:hypothetical protein
MNVNWGLNLSNSKDFVFSPVFRLPVGVLLNGFGGSFTSSNVARM